VTATLLAGGRRPVPAAPPPEASVEDLEVELLLRALHRAFGLDFRNYAPKSLRRRLRRRVDGEGVATVSGLQERVLHDPACLGRLLHDLSVNTTSMFRDPGFYRALRTGVAPMLRTYPSIRVWSAGCSSGEEVYSLAILLDEEGLLDRSRIYATDMSETVLERARAGAFPLEKMREYTSNYIAAGGARPFSERYAVDGDQARFAPALAENVVFAQHNLVTDRAFNEFHLVLCRNVLMYFDKALQARVHRLLHDSLGVFGVLGLGTKESLLFSGLEHRYQELAPATKLYRRVA
jgi:chemotaxis protein methyltransferase CheR